ncbi:pyruvate dehydrogenase (acetyl-transferring) E1 component subunit alpha [Streptomyces kunmingensis]
MPAVQLLSPEGELVENPDYALTLSGTELCGLYRDMAITRRLDTEGTTLQRQGELALWAPLLGQEAAQIGSGRAARPDDHVFPCYREHGVAWTRGVDALTLMGLYRGVKHGAWDPQEHHFHLYTLVIGPPLLHAVGYAMATARRPGDSAVLSYFGDGASSQGDVAEAFTYASVNRAPIVFFCQNNQWAISTPVSRQSRAPLYRRADGWGFPGVQVDGNDVLACLAVTRSALDAARSGEGPSLIEALTYRMAPHATSDDPTRYRDTEEVRAWEAKDPLRRLRAHLIAYGHAGPDFFTDLEAETELMARRLREGVRAMPDPDPVDMFRHVYVDEHAQVGEERRMFEDLQNSFAQEETVR